MHAKMWLLTVYAKSFRNKKKFENNEMRGNTPRFFQGFKAGEKKKKKKKSYFFFARAVIIIIILNL